MLTALCYCVIQLG